MDYLIGDSVDKEDLEDFSEFKEFNDFSVAFSPDSIDTFEENGRFFLFQGFLSNREDFDTERLQEGEAELVASIYDREKSSLRDLEGFYTAVVIGESDLEVFRDVFGSKPVYFSELDGSLIVSSGIRPILEQDSGLRKVNRDVARDYLKHGLADHRRETFFEDVSRLKPGEKLCYDGQVEIEEVEFSEAHSDDLKKIVREHIENLKPSGKFYCPVSGGLDSTVVASECDGEGKYIHAYFTHGTVDDRYIDSVKDEYGFDTEDTEISPARILETVEDNMRIQEEPTVFPAFQAQSILYQDLEDNSVIMSGTGADELFYGYQWFIPFYLAEKLRKRDISGFLKTLVNRRKEIRTYHLTKALKTFLSGSSKLIDLHSEKVIIGESDISDVSGIEEAKKYHLKDFYFPHMLRSIEKQSEEFNLEVRHCFLSREILSYSVSHEYEENFRKGLKKYLIRSNFRNDIPESVLNRKQKTGFVWMTNDLYTSETKEKFLKTFSSDSFQDRDLIKSKKALRLLQKNKMFFGTAYRLYAYEKWMQEFIDVKKE